jgi:hypothetical protein
MPTLSGVKTGKKFLKGRQKDNFQNLNIFSLKSKGGPKNKFSISNFDLKAGDIISKLETHTPGIPTRVANLNIIFIVLVC